MKTKNFVNKLFLSSTLLALLTASAGCGRNQSGNYTGTETISINGQAQSYTMNVTLTESSGSVTGTWQDQTGSGTLTGTISGDQITNVVLTSSGTNSQYGVCSSYIGNLSLANEQLSGSLAPNQPQAAQNQNGYQQPSSYMTCSGNRTLSLTLLK